MVMFLLQKFWNWLPVSYKEYAETGINTKKNMNEDEFLNFSDLKICAKKIVTDNILDDKEIDDLLTIMAIDNESEDTLEFIDGNSLEEQLLRIIFIGINHPLYHARWQLAELIYRRKPENYYVYLNVLSKDPHSYVRRRALNCIELLNNMDKV